jgi:hypothetical protein
MHRVIGCPTRAVRGPSCHCITFFVCTIALPYHQAAVVPAAAPQALHQHVRLVLPLHMQQQHRPALMRVRHACIPIKQCLEHVSGHSSMRLTHLQMAISGSTVNGSSICAPMFSVLSSRKATRPERGTVSQPLPDHISSGASVR